MKVIKNEITVIGGYGGGNVGDDALMWNVIKWLNVKFPNITPLLVVYDKKLILSVLSGLSYDVVDTFEDYSVESKVIIYGGGTQFFHFTKDKKKSSIIKKGFKFLLNPASFFKSLKKHVSKKEVKSNHKFLLGIGFGPFISKETVEYAKFLNVLEDAEHLYVRDSNSFQYIPETFLGKITKGTDICYNRFFKEVLVEANPEKFGNIKKTAIILRDWHYDNVDHEKLLLSLRQLISMKKEERFDLIFFCEQLDSNLKEKFRGLDNLDFWSWDPSSNNLVGFFDRMKTYDLVITSRFHGAIFSALLDIPFITLEIEPKLNVPNQMYGNESILKEPFQLEKLVNLISIAKDNTIVSEDTNNQLINIGDGMFEDLTSRISKLL